MGTGSSVQKVHNGRKPMNLQGRILATYQLLPSFKYCERLDCYVDNLSLVDVNLPPPSPPPTSKDEIFDLSKYTHVDKRAVETSQKFYKLTLQELVEHLIDGYEDDMSKARVIYRWITCQAVDQIKMKKEPPPSQTLFQLWRIKHKKGNYAQLVSLLCRFADIPCVIIHGQLKGSTYEVGDKIDDDVHYGEWNAVLINNHWRFINAYWGTCAEGTDDAVPNMAEEDAETKLFYDCDENYFLTDPDHLVSTHLPNNPKWQLKKKPVSMEEFEQMTFLKDRYFNMRLKTLSHPKCIVHSDTGEIELKFAVLRSRSIDLDFQYLMFRVREDQEKRYDRFVFLHKTNNLETLCIKIRSPNPDTYRFELVGKDRSVTDKTYDYDWIAIYKLIFNNALLGCQPYPIYPSIGWGPGIAAKEAGLVPLSHFSGEIQMDDSGKVEIHFGTADKTKLGDMVYSAMLYTGGAKQTELPDHVVHRVENGDVIFNVQTPCSGEYALKLNLHRKGKRGEMTAQKEWCNYFLMSKQKDKNTPFPRGFQERLGPKLPAFSTSGLIPSRPSGFIRTEKSEMKLVFTRKKDIELSVNMSGEKVRSSDAPRLMSQEEDDDDVIYTIRLPEIGQYGIKVRGTCEDGAQHEGLYDYVIDYRKIKKRSKKHPTIKQEAETFAESETVPDVMRRRIKMAKDEGNEDELKSAIDDLKHLELPSAKNDIKDAEKELQYMALSKELAIATKDRDVKKLQSTLKAINKTGLDTRLSEEVQFANILLERLLKLQRILKQVLALDQCTIAEIKAYINPPDVVQKVMQAVLLLLGHWEEETRKWKNILITLGKTGKESIKRLIAEIDLNKVPLDVALGAKNFIKDVDIDQVKLVSVGCATFYIWVKGVVEEIEKRAGDSVEGVRPRTSKKQRKREKTMVIEEL